MKPRIVVVGSSSTDHTIRLAHLPRPGETLLGEDYLTASGGKGANQAVAAARAGGAVTFVACLGRDAAGDRIIAGFRRDRINVDYIRRDRAAPSGVALIFVSDRGENAIAVAPGSNARLTAADVRRARALIAGASAVVLQLEIPLPTVTTAATLAARAGVRVILNPAPAQALPDALLRKVSILTPNETEAAALTGIKVTSVARAERAARALRARGVAIVIVTLGAQGALVVDERGSQLVPAFNVQPVDTVAAGDVFNGALAVELGRGRPLLDAVRFANAAAAIAVTRAGAQPSAPRRAEINALLRCGGSSPQFR